MNLEQMKEIAQRAFVEKKIERIYIQAFAPDKMLKVMAVLEAARAVNDLERTQTSGVVVDNVQDIIDYIYSMEDQLATLADAFKYLDDENNEKQSRIITQ